MIDNLTTMSEWKRLAALPREPKDDEHDIVLSLDGQEVRMHMSWFDCQPVPGNTYYYGWRHTASGGGYYMWLGSKAKAIQELSRIQKNWLYDLLDDIGASRTVLPEGHFEHMFSIFTVHRDRVNPLPATQLAYLYPRLAYEEWHK